MTPLASLRPAPDCFERLLKLVHKQEQAARWRKPGKNTYQEFGRLAVKKVQIIAARMGYETFSTTHKAAFDLWVCDARIEVKVSRWIEPKNHNTGRYQAAIRNHAADLVIFDALNGSDHWFIIPMSEVSPRRTIEITSYDVSRYKGQWADYLDAWHLLAAAVEAAKPRARQLHFPMETP